MPFEPNKVAKRLRTLLRRDLITHHDYAVADALLWSCRVPGRDEAQVSYRRLAQLAAVAYSTAVQAIAKLRALGILTWRKTRLRIAWRHGLASRQGRNVYRLLEGAHTESMRPPTDRGPVRKQDCSGGKWRETAGPQPPIRSVAEQLAILLGGSHA